MIKRLGIILLPIVIALVVSISIGVIFNILIPEESTMGGDCVEFSPGQSKCYPISSHGNLGSSIALVFFFPIAIISAIIFWITSLVQKNSRSINSTKK